MECNHILVRFGELTTKGKNRKLFIRKLTQNTKEMLKEFQHLRYDMSFDRLYIILNGENPEAVCEKLQTVFGIHSFYTAIPEWGHLPVGYSIAALR